ncbi:MAG: toll/interleukin-1 receptor domain-containing protein [Saprospirales bacterium]|nr:toll/interleukin-1 receptor domain-containing protein [Saprospirales bacterium]
MPKFRQNSENLPPAAGMPKEKIHIFISFDPSDVQTAEGLYRYLNQALEDRELVFWNPMQIAEEDYRKEAGQFLEKTQLFIACLSTHYLDSPNTRWSVDFALMEQKRRAGFHILVVLAQAAFVPAALAGFPLAPAPDQPVEGYSLSREIQLKRTVQKGVDLLFGVDRTGDLFILPEEAAFVLAFEDVRERLLVWLEHCDLEPLFLLLKQLLHPEKTPDALFQLEDAFGEWRQQTQRSKLSFDVFNQTVRAIRLDLGHLIERLDQSQCRNNWPVLFANTYYGLKPVNVPTDPLSGLFLPSGEIQIPQTLNLPATPPAEPPSPGSTGALTVQQQQEFRRNLLLAQDAIGMGQFGRAHTLCEQVRGNIDPQSAQLYELLLISYLKKEGPDRIIHDAVYGSGAKLNHVIVYAGRFADYQRQDICPTEADAYNLRATAQALSDALLRLYSTYQNDYILHTGRYAKEVPDNRAAIAHCVQVGMVVYRTVHPYRGFLELAANELCNGGKYDYIRQVEIIDDTFRFASHEDFGIESEIREIIGMLEAVSPDDDDALMNRQLRENLFFNLKAKRLRLQAQMEAERRRYLHFTDLRDSVIELVHAALLGYKIFGDRDYPDPESFLRLALEQLLPGLLLPTVSGTSAKAVGDLRWFTLDASGQVGAHPDCARFRFDVTAVVEKIVRDHAGQASWLQVHPNIKMEVYRQLMADTQKMYQHMAGELKWTDIRRPNETDARQAVIECLRQWKSASLAYPAYAAEHRQQILQELTGNKLLLWMRIDPPRLVTEADSTGLGYDAVAEYQELLEKNHDIDPAEANKLLANNLFRRQIRPDFDLLPAGEEKHRHELSSLLVQALHGYRDLFEAPEYLDFVLRS